MIQKKNQNLLNGRSYFENLDNSMLKHTRIYILKKILIYLSFSNITAPNIILNVLNALLRRNLTA